MKDFLKYLRPYKRDAALAVLCIELETVFELIIPLVMASIVDVGVASGDRHYILMKGLQMVFFALISLVLGQGSAMFSAGAARAWALRSARRSLQSSSSFPLPTRTISGVHPLSQGLPAM